MDYKQKTLNDIKNYYCKEEYFFHYIKFNSSFPAKRKKTNLENYEGVEKISVLKKEYDEQKVFVEDLKKVLEIKSPPIKLLKEKEDMSCKAVKFLIKNKKEQGIKLFKEENKFDKMVKKSKILTFLVGLIVLCITIFSAKSLDSWGLPTGLEVAAIFAIPTLTSIISIYILYKIIEYIFRFEKEEKTLKILNNNGIDGTKLIDFVFEEFLNKLEENKNSIQEEFDYLKKLEIEINKISDDLKKNEIV